MPRQCGACTACCTTLVIEALGKPAFTVCPHDCAGGCGSDAPSHDAAERTGGCAIYQDRPTACRNFRCLWLDGHLGDDDRPDKLGVIFTTTTHEAVGTLPMLVEYREGAADRPAVRDAIRRFTAHTSVLVLTAAGGKLHHRQPVATPRPARRVALPVLHRAA